MISFEIFFNDLKPETQQDILSIMKKESAEEMNWDIFPIAVLDIETENEDDRD
jgi:hypothetical protein